MLLKKKLCAVRLVLAAILLTMIAWVPGVQNVWADEYEDNWQKIGNFVLYMDPDEETLLYCEVNEGESGSYELVIPEIVAGVTVKHIGSGAFEKCSEITKLVLPSSVESIGIDAFYQCSGLKEINIPDKVQCIEDGTFSGCKALTKMILPNNLSQIGESAFEDCIALTEIKIPSHVTRIDWYAFQGCTGLKQVAFSEGLERIDEQAFYKCTGLIEVAIPRSVTYIGDGAFAGISDSFVIKGYKGTEAEEYATWDNLTFVALEGEFPSTPSEPETEKLAQTITAKSFTKTYGNKPFKLGASAKTGLTYKSSDTSVATVNSKGIVTLKGPGKTSITITAAANSKYKKATKKVTITVKPKKMAAPKVKSKKSKTITVSWKRDAKATGYELVLAENSKFTKGKGIIEIPGNKNITVTLDNMKKGKTHYFKIRAYKKVGATRLYGAYSKAKSGKVK